MFRCRRARRCFLAFLFVASNAARIRLIWTPLPKLIPNMFKTMLTTIVRAIEMFRVENGMVLIIVVEAFDGGSGVDRRENLARISDPT